MHIETHHRLRVDALPGQDHRKVEAFYLECVGVAARLHDIEGALLAGGITGGPFMLFESTDLHEMHKLRARIADLAVRRLINLED